VHNKAEIRREKPLVGARVTIVFDGLEPDAPNPAFAARLFTVSVLSRPERSHRVLKWNPSRSARTALSLPRDPSRRNEAAPLRRSRHSSRTTSSVPVLRPRVPAGTTNRSDGMPGRELQAKLIETAVAYAGRGLPIFPCNDASAGNAGGNVEPGARPVAFPARLGSFRSFSDPESALRRCLLTKRPGFARPGERRKTARPGQPPHR
jgi:hypothetical protein